MAGRMPGLRAWMLLQNASGGVSTIIARILRLCRRLRAGWQLLCTLPTPRDSLLAFVRASMLM